MPNGLFRASHSHNPTQYLDIVVEMHVKDYIWIDDVEIALYNYVGLLVKLGKCVKRQ